MIYLKTFESFVVNETLGDMMMLPIDITGPNISNAYKEILIDAKSILKNKFDDFVKSLDAAIDVAIQHVPANKILDNVEKFFGKDPNNLTEEDVKLTLSKHINQDDINNIEMNKPITESFGQTLLQKIISILENILLVNILSWGLFGVIISSLLGLSISFAISILLTLLAFIVIHFVKKLLLK